MALQLFVLCCFANSMFSTVHTPCQFHTTGCYARVHCLRRFEIYCFCNDRLIELGFPNYSGLVEYGSWHDTILGFFFKAFPFDLLIRRGHFAFVSGSASSQSGRNSLRERRNSLILTPSADRRADRSERATSQERPSQSRDVTSPPAPPSATSSTPGDQPQPFVRRRSARHRNYLNRSHLHQAVQLDSELPDGYGNSKPIITIF